MAAPIRPIMSASEISKAIREKKKKMLMSAPDLAGTSPTPDFNAQDVMDLEQDSRVEDAVGSEKKINADETMLNDNSRPEAMSKEPMSSPMNPKDHGRMAYGGEVMAHADPMAPSKMMAEELGGTNSSRSEMGQRIGEGFQTGEGIESEMKRRTMGRKMRLAGYLDSLGM